MPMNTNQREFFSAGSPSGTSQDIVTVGIVVDTNDPQQMGRVRAVCSQWGDSFDQDVLDIPWALYCAPFGGHLSTGTKGAGVQQSSGSVAYGMWAIPKIGAQVLMMRIDGDPRHRVYIGCLYDQHTPHTLPHGRFMFDDHPAMENTGGTMLPHGPFTTTEKPIAPLYNNLKQAFGHVDEPNYEWRSRAADYTASSVSVDQLAHTLSKVPDDATTLHDDWNSTQGYSMNRVRPESGLESSTYSLTSPGFHSISMDDRMENCRMRFRTTSGHQILLDDTNERIYISTATGNNWIELDQDGNIDVFTTNKLNIRAKRGINLTSDEDIRLHAAKSIHLTAGDEIRMTAASDISIGSSSNIRIQAADAALIEAASNISAKCGSDIVIDSGAQLGLVAAGEVLVQGSQVHWNGPSPAAATAAAAKPAAFTNRVPDHEPWARTMTKSDTTHDPEFSYTDKSVNRMERGRKIYRGAFWRR